MAVQKYFKIDVLHIMKIQRTKLVGIHCCLSLSHDPNVFHDKHLISNHGFLNQHCRGQHAMKKICCLGKDISERKKVKHEDISLEMVIPSRRQMEF